MTKAEYPSGKNVVEADTKNLLRLFHSIAIENHQIIRSIRILGNRRYCLILTIFLLLTEVRQILITNYYK